MTTDHKQHARELLPCPFCGGRPVLYGTARRVLAHVVCNDDEMGGCGSCGPGMPNDDSAIEAWNTRAALAQSAQQAVAVPEDRRARAGLRDMIAYSLPGIIHDNDQAREVADRVIDMVLAAAPPAPTGGWRSIESCPTNTDVLLWNNDIGEKVIGYRPDDAPHPECVIVAMTASYADAWYPLPDDPESEEAEDDTPAPVKQEVG